MRRYKQQELQPGRCTAPVSAYVFICFRVDIIEHQQQNKHAMLHIDCTLLALHGATSSCYLWRTVSIVTRPRKTTVLALSVSMLLERQGAQEGGRCGAVQASTHARGIDDSLACMLVCLLKDNMHATNNTLLRVFAWRS